MTTQAKRQTKPRAKAGARRAPTTGLVTMEIAPYLSDVGDLVLLHLDSRRRLKGRMSVRPNRGFIDGEKPGTFRIVEDDLSSLHAAAPERWCSCVREAPWRVSPGRVMLIAVDRRGRWVAEAEAPRKWDDGRLATWEALYRVVQQENARQDELCRARAERQARTRGDGAGDPQ